MKTIPEVIGFGFTVQASILALIVAGISTAAAADDREERLVDLLNQAPAEQRALAKQIDPVSAVDVGDADSFGRNVHFIGVVATGTVAVEADCTPDPSAPPGPDDRCVVALGPPLTTTIEVRDVGRTYAQPVPAPSSAPQPLAPPRDNTINRHLGFFLRPDLGLGYMSTSEPTGTSAGDLTISGVAGVFGFVVGGAIRENMIVGVHLYDGVIANPKVSLSSGQSATTSNTSLAMVGIGPEFTYYWMPSNIYFSGTVALTRMALTANGKDSNSNAGFGTRLALGKEWWVSDHWGLGLAGHVSFSSNQDSGGGSPPRLTTWVFGLAFSATYN